MALPQTGQVVSSSPGPLRLVAYPGDNMVLLAMSLPDDAINDTDKNLAGFAIFRTVPGKPEQPLSNRLSFTIQVTKDTTPEDRKWTPSPNAPFQKFRWVDVLPDDFTAAVSYRVVARYFTGQGTTLKDGPQASLTVSPPQLAHSDFRVAFTRGYASSQAYADKFHNKDIRPAQKTPDFDTKPYAAQYEWLGADARKQLFKFIADCQADKQSKVDVFAYDLDEPDVIRAMCGFGKEGRLRAILDNAPLHTKATAIEPKAAKLIEAAAGTGNVQLGHFGRFQHNKVFIKRDKASGKAQQVLFGSMNFSLRGIYVQANNILVSNDPTTAGYFAQAFDEAWKDKVQQGLFAASPISQQYNLISAANTAKLPQSAVALSPHKSYDISLDSMRDTIRAAKSSVLFAVMEPTGGGPVLTTLRQIAAKPTIFSYGTVETDTGLAVQSGDGAMGAVTSYSYLKDKVPAPFTAEWSGGNGMHIHHKFVVVDFNDSSPAVFAGSSNLASGGEEQNGDNLIRIEDPVIASMYAIEAVRLFDHYAFRKYMAKATNTKPFTLWYPGKPQGGPAWWKTAYDKTHIKFRDRYIFADLPMPAGVLTRKEPDWAAIDKLAAKGQTKKKTKAGAKLKASKAKPAKKTKVKKKVTKKAKKKTKKKVKKRK